MQDQMIEYAIVGGGIAGLATAFGLNKIGIRPTVFEAAPQFKPLGAGLILAANAMKALDYLELAQAVSEVAYPVRQMHVLNHKGKRLMKTTPAIDGDSWKAYQIHRGDLHAVLLGQLPKEQVLFGKRLETIQQEGEGFALEFEDGTRVLAKNIIAAEGIHSKVRQFILPQSKERYAGYTCWRGIAEDIQLDGNTSETWGPKGRFGIVPLTNDRIYWFAVVNAPQNNDRLGKWSLSDIQTHFQDYHHAVQKVLANTPKSQVLWNDIIDLKPIHQFAFGQLVLIGDAAHATTPNMGQGACMAIEDAAVLVHCLQQNSDPLSAFQTFEKKRISRTHQIVNQSWQMGKMAQNQHPVTGAIRNTLMKMVPDKLAQKRMRQIFAFEV